MQDFEKLGVFYLGKEYDQTARAEKTDLVLYESKDLTTHAVCVGMTGSGKTGLCLALLEEAAIHGIPAIAIDPKGDLGNLLLTFPQLQPQDFRPWVDEGEAARQGITPDELASKSAQQWRDGLAHWGEDGARIERFRNSVDLAIYTPGSNAGLPLTVLRSFAAPAPAIVADADLLRERIVAAVSGLLALLGIEADPIRSREHILLSQLLDRAWREGRDLDIAGLIGGIQKPPFDKVGFIDLETFFPGKERFALAMSLNNLLASPGFAGWMEGEPLDVGRLLYTPQGKPRLSILSIAHLADAERMFFITILLNEVLAWVRSQPGTSSLRALLYMDEVAGYFPPSASPPSKMPMLTLLKQARAFGLGVVLATQNPVDLDYKGLSNAGTWFLGRLQTERDKARVLEGLEGASAAAGANFDRKKMETILAGLGARVFLMNNVHDDRPIVFQSRWCLSFLRGPLTRGQIATLMAPRKQKSAQAPAAAAVSATNTAPAAGSAPASSAAASAAAAPAATAPVVATGDHPLLPAEAGECFVPRRGAAGSRLVYRPALFGVGRVHFVDSKANVDQWQTVAVLAPVGSDLAEDVWESAQPWPDPDADFDKQPESGVAFDSAPAALSRAKSYATWQKALAAYLYRGQTLKLWNCPALKEMSPAGASEGDFRATLAHQAREQRDAAVAKLRQKYASKISTLQSQIQRADERVAREKSSRGQEVLQTAISVGSSILNAVLGNKGISRSTVSGAATAMRKAGRTASAQQSVGRASDDAEMLRNKLADLEAEVKGEVDSIEAAGSADQITLQEYPVRPRKSDISVTKVVLAWTPWHVAADGKAEPAY